MPSPRVTVTESGQARAIVNLISRSNESLLTRAEFKAEMKELRAEIEARFTAIEARMDRLEARFDELDAKFAKRFYVGFIGIVALMIAIQTITLQILS